MLIDDIRSVLPQLRAEAEAVMVDACTITRSSGPPVLDENTGIYTDPPVTVIYEGRCKVQQARTVAPGTPEAGEREWTVLDLEVHIPADVSGVNVDDTVNVTASTLDPALAGRSFRVTDDPAKTFATARRLRCEEII